jgi:hypothetical protein
MNCKGQQIIFGRITVYRRYSSATAWAGLPYSPPLPTWPTPWG